MIFSVEGHIEQIKAGTKTQTRRGSGKYQVGKLYAVQPGRTKPGIPDGKILIVAKRIEARPPNMSSAWWKISPEEARDEGGYTPEEYEELYEKMHPGWTRRWAYLFKYYPIEAIEMMKRGQFPEFMVT